MIRIFDIFFSLIGLIFLSPLLILLWFIGLLDNGSPLFIQKRVGRNLQSFILIKFRTMPKKTRSVGTHLIEDIKYKVKKLIHVQRVLIRRIKKLHTIFPQTHC